MRKKKILKAETAGAITAAAPLDQSCSCWVKQRNGLSMSEKTKTKKELMLNHRC